MDCRRIDVAQLGHVDGAHVANQAPPQTASRVELCIQQFASFGLGRWAAVYENRSWEYIIAFLCDF